MKKLLLILSIITSLNNYAQATLVKDINLGNGSSNPSAKIVFKNEVYFAANNGINGTELWKTDGTEAGTVLVKDIYAGIETGIKNFKALATTDFLYFFAVEDSKQYLYKTDGTATGTEKVKEFSSVNEMYDEINGKIIFSAENSLWASDGTAAGTEKIATYTIFGADRFVKNGNEIYFSAEASSSIGKELYKTDGTVAGTVLVKNIRSGSSDSFPNQFTVLNGVVYFSANNGSSGTELWTTDGTSSGTIMVKDINPGSGSTFAYNSSLKNLNNELFFIYDNGLWKSDGTDAGTLAVKGDLGIIKTLFIVNNSVLVIAYNATTQKQVIWVSDGTEAGTTNFNPNYREFAHNSEYGIVGNNLYFQGNTVTEGYELWKTDGTEAGTFLVKDVHPQGDDNNIENIVDLNGKAVFTGSDGNWLGKELWISDGTETGTYMLKDINKLGNNSSSPSNHFQFGTKILFSADNGEYGREPWVLENGTATLLKDINVGALYSNPSNFIELNGLVYFYATSAEKGKELWKTDGTEAGTVLVKDINPNAGSGISSNYLITLNGKLYFYAYDAVNGSELWESDGTETGTVLVKDINTGAASSIRSGELYVFKSKIYFNATDSSNDYELWSSDGTEAGTSLFYEANSSSSGSPDNFIEFKDGLHFRANSSSGSRMFRTDGTNTFSVTDKGYNNMTVSGEYLYFVSTYSNGGELWATQSGVSPYQVKDIRPGSGGSKGSFPSLLTDHKGVLYFVANDGTNGTELWKSDGTNSGTVLVKNIGSGSDSAYMTQLISFGDKLVFGSGESSSSQEVWVSDGTENGTKILQEINPSTEQFNSGSRPQSFFVSNNILYFSANNGTVGNELFMLEEAALSTNNQTLSELVEVIIYPNPTLDILNIKVDNKQIQAISIFNLLGKEVLKLKNIDKEINISQLSKGMYILQIKTDKNTFIKKIIKN
ncbi:ELWxxDGT repeat protein [Polaribacter porphyrae]|uniref:Uncharacterized protein n=1 Tax=Polaribacter porphyrae TaxID=1137780 RepID=A0A2S7WSC5_9FLAO|nr:ELWxxDGT repeat protein [Polaribacter porphyrae]PQJ80222.1 hypothetical protein BTO18_14015 [Polaribacter porphyrae]